MDDIQFGKDFLWGGGFAANQMEGAAFEDGKGLCVADINEYQKTFHWRNATTLKSRLQSFRTRSRQKDGISRNAAGLIFIILIKRICGF